MALKGNFKIQLTMNQANQIDLFNQPVTGKQAANNYILGCTK